MIFNRDLLYENVGCSEELVFELIKIFYEDAPDGYEKIKTALAEKNYKEIRDCAHGVKGAALSINAEDYSEAARNLELAAIEKNNDLEALEKKFENQYNILMNELNKIMEKI